MDEPQHDGPDRDDLIRPTGNVNPTGMPSGPIGMGVFLAFWLVVAIALRRDLSGFWWALVAIIGGVLVMGVSVLLINLDEKVLEPRAWAGPLRGVLSGVILVAIVAGFLSCVIGVLAAGWSLGGAIAPIMFGG